jgi:hypothetical protein
MQHRLIRPLVAALALVLCAAPGPASATVPGTTLPLTGFSHMVVDGAHGHVFITGSSADSKIVVLNEDGTTAKTITGESGAGGMVLDGATLYVARCGWSTIDEIDTATLTKTGSISAPVGGTCDLAEAGGRLWFSDSTDQQFGHLQSVSLDSSHTITDTGRNLYQMIFATTPAQPNWLVVGESQGSPTSVWVLDVTDPTNVTTVTHNLSLVGGGGNLGDMAITSDGSTLLTADGSPYELDAFSLPGLTAAGVYPTAPYPTAVAASPNGQQFAQGLNGIYNPDVYLFDAGNSTAKSHWDFGGTDDVTYSHGLAFSSDGTHLFAVSKGPSAGAPVFHVLATVVLPKGAVTIKASRTTISNGGSVTLTAHLGTSSSNRTLSIYRTPVGGTRTLVKTAGVNGSGNLSVAVRPTANVNYTAVWGGDSTHASTTSKAVRVNVRLVMHAATQGGYRTASGVRLYHYTGHCVNAPHTGCPRFQAWASPLQPGRNVNFLIQGRTPSGTWKKLLSGTLRTAAGGKAGVIVYYSGRAVIGIQQRIRFSMVKDARHLGNTSAWVRFRVTS